MHYYRLYISSTGNRKDKKIVKDDVSKRELETEMWTLRNVLKKEGKINSIRFFINEVTEKEVAST